MPRLEAASISKTSIEEPSAILRHCSHCPHGSGVGPCSQLSAFAKIFAVLVLPVPRGPAKRYAWPIWPLVIAFASVRLICSCPTRSLNVCGLHFRYSAIYAIATPLLSYDYYIIIPTNEPPRKGIQRSAQQAEAPLMDTLPWLSAAHGPAKSRRRSGHRGWMVISGALTRCVKNRFFAHENPFERASSKRSAFSAFGRMD